MNRNHVWCHMIRSKTSLVLLLQCEEKGLIPLFKCLCQKKHYSGVKSGLSFRYRVEEPRGKSRREGMQTRGKTCYHFLRSPVLQVLKDGKMWDYRKRGKEIGNEQISDLKLLRNLPFILWIKTNYKEVTVDAVEDNLEKGQKREKNSLRGSNNNLDDMRWMNEPTDKWLIR